MRKFRALLVKELRELLTPQILVPFAVVIAVFSLIGNVVGSETEKSLGAPSIALVDLDRSEASAGVGEALEGAGFRVRALPPSAVKDVAAAMPAGVSSAVVVPKGFGAGVAAGKPQRVGTYAVMRGFSFASIRDPLELKAVLAAVNDSAAAALLERRAPGVDPAALREPVGVTEHVVVGGKTAEASAESVVAFITAQTTFIPIVLFMVIVFAAQMIATTIATEKENKTLETLLSVPVSRTSMVVAKMVAAALVALVSAAVYIIGVRNYMAGVTGMDAISTGGVSPQVLEQLGLALGAGDYVLLGLSLFAGILAALGIAVILGAFAENVKAVQSLLAPLMVLVMVPYLLTMFVDIRTASPVLRWMIYAIPFSHPFMAAPNLFLHEGWRVAAGAAYEAAWFLGFAVLAGRIFSSDKVLTMKLRFGRKREAG